MQEIEDRKAEEEKKSPDSEETGWGCAVVLLVVLGIVVGLVLGWGWILDTVDRVGFSFFSEEESSIKEERVRETDLGFEASSGEEEATKSLEAPDQSPLEEENLPESTEVPEDFGSIESIKIPTEVPIEKRDLLPTQDFSRKSTVEPSLKPSPTSGDFEKERDQGTRLPGPGMEDLDPDPDFIEEGVEEDTEELETLLFERGWAVGAAGWSLFFTLDKVSGPESAVFRCIKIKTADGIESLHRISFLKSPTEEYSGSMILSRNRISKLDLNSQDWIKLNLDPRIVETSLC